MIIDEKEEKKKSDLKNRNYRNEQYMQYLNMPKRNRFQCLSAIAFEFIACTSIQITTQILHERYHQNGAQN